MDKENDQQLTVLRLSCCPPTIADQTCKFLCERKSVMPRLWPSSGVDGLKRMVYKPGLYTHLTLDNLFEVCC